MKRILTLLPLLLAPLMLCAADFQITVDRDRTNAAGAKKTTEHEVKTTGGGMQTSKTNSEPETLIYNVTVANTSFKPTNALKAEYIVFVERQELGAKAGTETTEKVRGTADIKALVPRASDAFKTEELTLRTQSLVGYWHYKNGGRIKAKDSVKGVWIKLMDGDKLVAEYVNPSTIKAKEQW